jgi:hypothetical protein
MFVRALFSSCLIAQQRRKEVNSMCCDTHGHHAERAWHGHGEHGSCCCCAPGGFVRRFESRGERLARLESYRDELTKELDGVNEALGELAEG